MGFDFENGFAKAMYENRLKTSLAKEEQARRNKAKAEQMFQEINMLIQNTYSQIIKWSKNGTLFKTRHELKTTNLDIVDLVLEVKTPILFCNTHNQVKIEFTFRNSNDPQSAPSALIRKDAIGFLGFSDEHEVSMGFDLIFQGEKLVIAQYDKFDEVFTPVHTDEMGNLLIYLLTKTKLDKYDDQLLEKCR